MKRKTISNLLIIVVFTIFSCNQRNPSTDQEASNNQPKTQTTVSIEGEKVLINGELTYKDKSWKGHNIEGLLFNSRMVQGIFDDLNPETVDKWVYPDTKTWDPERNTNEFVAAMDDWYAHGLLSFTINLQGGSPFGYSKDQPWHNSAIDSLGNLRDDYMNRLETILNKADELGMVPILGIFYFGQDERLKDEEAVKNAVSNTINWLHEKGYRNILIEVANECNNRKYEQEIIKQDGIHELINLAKSIEQDGYRYLVGTSFNGNTLPPANVVEVSDFILIHGNGVHDPERIIEMVEQVRAMPEYTPMPVIFNEDDHYDFDQPMNNMVAAISTYASWGYFDFRREGEPFEDGYQSVPVDWGISSERKKGFFDFLQEVTGNADAETE